MTKSMMMKSEKSEKQMEIKTTVRVHPDVQDEFLKDCKKNLRSYTSQIEWLIYDHYNTQELERLRQEFEKEANADQIVQRDPKPVYEPREAQESDELKQRRSGDQEQT